MIIILNNWTKYEKTWLVSMLAITLGVFFYQGMHNVLGLITSVLGLLYVVNVARGSIWCYLFAILQMSLYSYVSYESKVYGEFMLNAFYSLPMQFIGFYIWKRHKTDGHVETLSLKTKSKISIFSLWIVCIVLYMTILRLLGGYTPFMDSVTAVTSVIAYVLSAKRYKEQWILWIVVNSMALALWVLALLRGDLNALSMIVMWAGYLINAIYGYWNWTKIGKEN